MTLPTTDPKLLEYLARRGASEKVASLSHGRLRYLEIPGDGPPLVILHGFTYCSGGDRFLPHMQQLAPHYHVYAVDMMGWGPGDRPKFEYSSPVHIVVAFRELLDALGIDRCYLVGHCFGGRLALAFAYDSPHRVEAMIIAAISTRSTPKTLPTTESFRGAPSRERLLAVTKDQIGDVPNVDCEELTDWAWRTSEIPTVVPTFRRFLGHFSDPVQKVMGDFRRKQWKYIADVPTLLAWPDQDPVGPLEDGYAFHRMMPHAAFQVCKGNHFFPSQYVDDFVQRILGFFGGVKSRFSSIA